jgi:pilus assembly protein CpaB
MISKFNKNWLLLAGAIVLAVLAFYLSNTVISNRMSQIEAELKAGRKTKAVVVAARNLEAGDVLTSDTAAVREFPVEFLHESAVSSDQFDRLEGEALLVGVRAGEPILPVYTVTRGGAFFSGSVKEGRRALTIEVDELSSIAGMVRPGDKIDLIMTAKPPAMTQGVTMLGARSERFTFPLLSDVEVLATGRTQRGTGGQTATYSTVTLNVTPQEANAIIAAKADSSVTAVLRSPKDDKPNPSRAISVSDVVAEVANLKKLNAVEYIVGGRAGGAGTSSVLSVPVTNKDATGSDLPSGVLR